MNKGLYDKYEVYKDGEPIENCFVLRPDRDRAAYDSLWTYAHSTDNDRLANHLRLWLSEIAYEMEESK